MKEVEKIQILQKEYDTLRAEILNRIGHRFTFLSFAGAIGGYAIFSENKLTDDQSSVLWICADILLCLWAWIGLLMKRCSDRVAAIEREINALAGETLLKW